MATHRVHPLLSPPRSTLLGVACKDGVVMGVEKAIVSKMLVEGSNRRLFTVGMNAGVVSTRHQRRNLC